MKTRSSIGIDVHKFVDNKPLIIGGILIDHTKGLKGHSDGDVLAHAIIDSLLGGAAMGDIGTYFPSSDDNWKDINSMVLLEKTMDIIEKEGWAPSYLDATIIAQTPVLSPYVLKIKNNLSNYLRITPENVNIKATTTDGLGFLGNSQGIATLVVATMENII